VRKKTSDRESVVFIGGSAASPNAAARAKRTNPELERYKDHDGADFERSGKFERLAWLGFGDGK
jgi:hypothetical protein